MNIVHVFQAWPTPTPFPVSGVSATPVFTAVDGVDVSLAEWIVQGYQAANSAGVVDFIMLAAILLLVMGGILSIIRHAQKL